MEIKPETAINAVFQGIVFGDNSIFQRHSIESWRSSILYSIYKFSPVRFNAKTKKWWVDYDLRKKIATELSLDYNDPNQLEYFVSKIKPYIPTAIYTTPSINQIIEVHLQNNISKNDVFENMNNRGIFYVYAHTFKGQMYIGRTNDLVARWFDHFDSAFNPFHPDYNYPFKKLIRKKYHKIRHHLLFITDNKELAEDYEAQAIDFYKPNLNTKNEIPKLNHNFIINEIVHHSPIIPMSRKSRNWTYSNKSPIMAVARYDKSKGYIRIYCDKGQIYPEGILVTCSKHQRQKLKHNQKVIINVTWQSTHKCLNGLGEDIVKI